MGSRSDKTSHQLLVEQFMRHAKQEVPESPRIPSEDVRLLRAKLIFEEALETIKALGFMPCAINEDGGGDVSIGGMDDVYMYSCFDPDLVEIADGCADIAVVTTGTLSACGIAADSIQREVDENNLAKFGEGHKWREDGKLIKPPSHRPPGIYGLLVRQGWKPLEGVDLNLEIAEVKSDVRQLQMTWCESHVCGQYPTIDGKGIVSVWPCTEEFMGPEVSEGWEHRMIPLQADDGLPAVGMWCCPLHKGDDVVEAFLRVFHAGPLKKFVERVDHDRDND